MLHFCLVCYDDFVVVEEVLDEVLDDFDDDDFEVEEQEVDDKDKV